MTTPRFHPDYPSPDEPVSPSDVRVYGEGCRRDPVCGFVIEQSMGMGVTTLDWQRENFCVELGKKLGPEAEIAMRLKIKLAKGNK
jgi:hypothetical protein